MSNKATSKQALERSTSSSGRLANLCPTARLPIRLGLGCAWLYGNAPSDLESVQELVQAALDAGFCLLDTADSYGPFVSESLLGAVLATFRRDLVICTKGGYPYDETVKDFRVNGRPEFLRRSCHDSLRRLRIDTIDLYYLHRIDPDVPVEESWGSLTDLVREGKVRSLGICNPTASELTRIQNIFPVTAVQAELSLWSRQALVDLVPWCRESDASFVAFAPLGRGYLTGATDISSSEGDYRRSLRIPLSERLQASRALLKAVSEVAERRRATAAQVAVAWVLAQAPYIFAIPGSGRHEHVEENAAAANLSLTEEDLLLLAYGSEGDLLNSSISDYESEG